MTKRGFTLIELLVSIAIFSLLSSFVVANYQGNERTRKLKNQAELIVSGLEKAQNMAMTGQLTDNFTPVSYKFLIKNCQSSCSYQIDAVFSGEAEEVLVATTNLSDAQIKTSSGSDLAVNFNLPRGRMIIGESSPWAWLEISNGENTYCLKITAVSGRIDIKNGTCNQ